MNPLQISRVETTADAILKKEALASRDIELQQIRDQRRLISAAKVGLLNHANAPAHLKKPVLDFDPAVLQGMTKKLAAKHGVPDSVASSAVMTAYGAMQEDRLRKELDKHHIATAGIKIMAASNPAPKVPKYESLQEDTDHTLVQSRRRGPTPPGAN